MAWSRSKCLVLCGDISWSNCLSNEWHGRKIGGEGWRMGKISSKSEILWNGKILQKSLEVLCEADFSYATTSPSGDLYPRLSSAEATGKSLPSCVSIALAVKRSFTQHVGISCGEQLFKCLLLWLYYYSKAGESSFFPFAPIIELIQEWYIDGLWKGSRTDV